MSDIDVAQKDNRLGAQYAQGNDGIFAFLGQGQNTATGEPNISYKIEDGDSAKTFFGEGSPLHKSIKLHFSRGGQPIHAAMPTNDLPGSVGTITKAGTGLGNLANNAGSVPTKSMSIVVHCTKSGGDATAEIRVSYDDGLTWTAPVVLSGAQIVLLGGVTLDVTYDGVTPEQSFVVNDKYSFTVTAPTFSLINLEACLEAFRKNNEIRIIRPVGAVDLSFAYAFDTFLTEMAQKKRWVMGVINLRDQNQDEADINYYNYLLNFAQSFYSKKICVVYKQYKSKAIGEYTSEASLLCSTLSKAKVQESPGWTGEFPQEDVEEIKNWSFLETVYASLRDEGLESLYYEDGEAAGNYPYFGIGRIKTGSGSDYRKVSSVRVMDKACRLVYNAIFPFLRSTQTSDPVAGNTAGVLTLKSAISEALKGMVGNFEIGGYEINIPMLDDPTKTIADIAMAIIKGNLKGTFKLHSVGHLESIEFDAMYAIPDELALAD